MNKADRIELENSLKELRKEKEGLVAKVLAENSLEEAQVMDGRIAEIELEIIKGENSLKADAEAKEDANKGKGKKGNMTYLESENSVKEFIDVLRSNKKDDVKTAWDAKLSENGITVTDTTLQLPKKIVESIQTSLTDSNPVFKVFKLTHVGALIVSSLLSSTDEALVHVEGTEKKEQAATLKVSTIQPAMIYKLQTISEYVKNLNANYAELYSIIVAELTQAIVNKVVDLALLEGDGTNGFQAIMKDTRTDFVKKITGTDYLEAVEDGVDFVRQTAGRTYLIVTVAQRRAILHALRQTVSSQGGRIRNNDAEIASEIGVDEIIVYTGTKDINPIVLKDKAYHIDMKDLTKVDAFDWKTNQNAILIESLSAGHLELMHSGAWLEVTAPASK